MNPNGMRILGALRPKRILFLCLIVAIAFYAGGVLGFGKGYSAARFAESGNLAVTVFALRQLRSGTPKPVINVLERQLDDLLIETRAGRPSFRSWFNVPWVMGVATSSNIEEAASPAVAYRAEYPSPAQGPLGIEIQKAIEQLKKLTQEQGESHTRTAD